MAKKLIKTKIPQASLKMFLNKPRGGPQKRRKMQDALLFYKNVIKLCICHGIS